METTSLARRTASAAGAAGTIVDVQLAIAPTVSTDNLIAPYIRPTHVSDFLRSVAMRLTQQPDVY